jgi:hypothetical protein
MALTRPYGHGRNRRVFSLPKKRFSDTYQENDHGISETGTGQSPTEERPEAGEEDNSCTDTNTEKVKEI